MNQPTTIADDHSAYDHPGVLLPYRRSPAGRPHHSPRANPAFTETLHAAPALVIVPTFRAIGDSLFLLAFTQAFAAYRTIRPDLTDQLLLPASSADLTRHLHLPGLTIDWFDDRDLYDIGLAAEHDGAVLITDGRFHIPAGSEAWRLDVTHAYPPRYLEHDPDRPLRIHTDLTTRYALALEELVGIVLPLDPAHAHPKFVFPTRPESLGPSDSTHVGVVVTASTPAKNYGADQFLCALASATAHTSSPLTAHIVLPLDGATGPAPNAADFPGINIVTHDKLTLVDASHLLAWCDLVIGNDTGLTQLAATSYPSPATIGQQPLSPVIAVYGRYDHAMWAISPRIHPVPSATASWMHDHNRAQVLTTDEWDRWASTAHVGSVGPDHLSHAIRQHLGLPHSHPWPDIVDAVTNLGQRHLPGPPPTPPSPEAHPTELIEALLHLHTTNWDLEDQTRDLDDLHEIGRIKGLIDHHNQRRHQLIEQLDAQILQRVSMNTDAPLSTETPAMIIDRLTVLTIRRSHLSHRATDNRGASAAEQQWGELLDGFKRLLTDLATGQRRCRSYRALKTYGTEDCFGTPD